MNLKYDVPNGWSFPTFEELASQENGGIRIGPFGSALKKEEYVESGIGVLGIEHVLPNRFCWDTPKYIPKEKYAELTQYTVKPGDVLVTNMGTVGRACFVPDGIETSIISSHLIKATLDADRCDPKYLCYVMNESSMVKAQIKAKSHGAIMAGFNSSLLKSLRIPLPPLPMQRRITAVLDKAQALVANDRRTLAVYDQLAKSLFLEMFGDGNPQTRTWPVVELKDLVSSEPNSMRSGPFGSDLLHSEFVDEGVAVLGIDNAVQNRFSWMGRRFITPEKYEKLKRYTVRPGDVLVTIMATIGRSAVVPDDVGPAINSKHLAAITLDRTKALPTFISFSIHSDDRIINQLFARSRGAIMSGLNLSLMKELKLRIPPVAVQRQFHEALMHLERQKAQAETSLRRSEGLFGSLLAGAFSGELGGCN